MSMASVSCWHFSWEYIWEYKEGDKECNIELLKKLDRSKEDNPNTFYKNYFVYIWNMLNKQAKKELINRFVSSFGIVRTGNYDIEIANIKFTDELVSKSTKEFLDYLKSILKHNLKFKKNGIKLY